MKEILDQEQDSELESSDNLSPDPHTKEGFR